jgi:hypothetical protein
MDYEFIDEIKAIQLLTQANDEFNGVNSIEEFMNDPYAASEYIRCYLLSLDPFTLYLDSDVEIVPPISEIFNEKPGMEFCKSTGYHNIGVIWNGNRTDIFKDLCKYWFTQKQVRHIIGSIGTAAKANDFIQYKPSWFIHYMYITYGKVR